MLVALRERLEKFKLTLHGDKTRLIEFGKLVAEHRRARNTRRPGTFSFLGFTHYCGWSRDGRFVVKRRTEGRRVSRKLQEVQAELRRRMHTPIHAQHRWLCSVLRGHDRLLRAAEQLATPGSLSRCGEAPLVPSAVPTESTPPDLGAIQRVAGTLPIAFDPHHSPARGFLGLRWVTFRRSRVRESRTLGSVGAKAEWLSYPTISSPGVAGDSATSEAKTAMMPLPVNQGRREGRPSLCRIIAASCSTARASAGRADELVRPGIATQRQRPWSFRHSGRRLLPALASRSCRPRKARSTRRRRALGCTGRITQRRGRRT